MPRRTRKFVAALGLARRLRLSKATTHEALYRALVRRGYRWDPAMGKDGGWFVVAEILGVSPPRRPVQQAAHAAPFAGLPMAHLASELARLGPLEAAVTRLASRVSALEKALLLLERAPGTQERLEELFGVDLGDSTPNS